VEGYSLTEAMMALCVNPVRGVNSRVGWHAAPRVVRIVDADDGVTVISRGPGGPDAVGKSASPRS
jgi:hypothetical protein